MHKVIFFALVIIACLRVPEVHAGRICYFDEVWGKSCSRYFSGFDCTGVTTDIVKTVADGVDSACDCIKECIKIGTLCVSWVWKFTDTSGSRTCTLYSNFNLPANVTISYNVGNSTQILPLLTMNNPQAGSTVPHCTVDGTATGNPDKYCKSGPAFLLDNGKTAC